MMRWVMILRSAFLSVSMLLPTLVVAAEPVRCARDDFGNIVCVDRNGMVTTAPEQRQEKVSAAQSAVAGSVGEESNLGHVRCSMDPFGNRVCR